MRELQSSFIQFHEAIRLEMDDKDILIKKRKKVEDAIASGVTEFKVVFFNQGSYSTFTGVLPYEDGDYDIDRGAIGNFTREDMTPKKAKETLYNALVGMFGDENVKVKQPCVTVIFPEDNVHVDVALYCIEDENIFLARGKLGSLEENISWEEADPKVLTQKINSAMDNVDDRKQFRRIIRYLKHWKDIKFKNQENRPTGIGISVFALNNFRPKKTIDSMSFNTNYKDAEALKDFVSTMISNFKQKYDSDKKEFYPRLEVILPVKPYKDVYTKVSNVQMKDFHDKLVVLRDALDDAINTSDLHEATTILNKQFGEEFQIIEQEETAEKFSSRAIISDHPSA